VLEEVDREAALADEQLRGGDVDRARALERADGVDPAGGGVAERERERAHDSQAVRDPDHRARLLGHEVGARRLEREDLDPLPWPWPVERRAVQEGAAAALAPPLLPRPVVPDV